MLQRKMVIQVQQRAGTSRENRDCSVNRDRSADLRQGSEMPLVGRSVGWRCTVDRLHRLNVSWAPIRRFHGIEQRRLALFGLHLL